MSPATDKVTSSLSPADKKLYEHQLDKKSWNQGQVSGHLPYQIYMRRFYEVEVVFRNNDDVDYHFFPNRGRFDFPLPVKIFGMLLEDATIWAIGRDIKIIADFYDQNVTKYFVRRADPTTVLGQPSFCVSVKQVAKRIGAHSILVDRFLGRLDELLERCALKLISTDPTSLYREMKSARWRN